MTITPLPVQPPSLGSRPQSTDCPTGQASPAEDFAALLGGHLASPVLAAPPGSEQEQVEDRPADTAAPPVEMLLAGALPVSPVPGTPAGTSVSSAVAEAQAASVPAAAAAGGQGTPLRATRTPVSPVVDQAAPRASTRRPPPLDTGTPRADAVPVLPALQGSGDAIEIALPVRPGQAADAPAPTPLPSAVLPGAPAATIEDAAGSKPAPAGTSPVLTQVVPVLSRVVSRGDGEHRMMLRLHPADLGEVHLTVTVRGDHVDVEIAAGAEAREVLREGSTQLRSLLESIGRTTGQLVLRDLPVSPPPAGGPSTAGPGADGGQATSYADSRDGRGGRPDTGDGPHRPRRADQPLEHTAVTPRASGRTTVPGGTALDVTV